MIVEPHECRSVSIRAFPPNPPEQHTLQDYQADLVSRFGRVPSWTELAKRENSAMWKACGRHDVRLTEAPKTERVQELRDAFGAKREARSAAILDYLGEARTSGDVATRFKISEPTAQQALREMKESGKVIMWRTRRMALWQRQQEAAE